MDFIVLKEDVSKSPIVVQIREQSVDSETHSTSSSPSTSSRILKTTNRAQQSQYTPLPRVSSLLKCQEGTRFALSRLHVAMQDLAYTDRPVSQVGKFTHRYVMPLSSYGGQNDRIILDGQRAGRVSIRNGMGLIQHSIQAASHNYAGLYGRDMDLHHFALEQLPVNISPGNQVLEDAMCRAVRKHFQVDFCVATSTGYGANLLALSAIPDENWLVVFDGKSHNSLFVGVYLGRPGRVRKFIHNDMKHLEEVLLEEGKQFTHTLVVVEGFYSMDGTTPDLGGLFRLKQRFGFTLLADEAHSILGLGSTGRGCVERWNEDGTLDPVPSDLIDLRTATLSKAIGTVGGIVCGTDKFEDSIRRRRDEMIRSGSQAITTAACVQTIHVINQTTLVRRNLKRLKAMAVYCREYLAHTGIYIYGEYDSPILPVYAGRPSCAAKLSYVLRQHGVIATPVSAPAVPFWESRVRVCLSAAFDNKTVCELLHLVVKASRKVGLCRGRPHPSAQFNRDGSKPIQQELEEAAESSQQLRTLLEQCAATADHHTLDTETLKTGHDALTTYGLGSGGARWIVGTTELHVQLENTVSKLFGNLKAMTYPDTYMGWLSTIAALCRPIDGFSKHEIFVPEDMPSDIADGLRVAPKRGCPIVQHYGSLTALPQLIRSCNRSCYATIILDVKDLSEASSVTGILKQLGLARTTANTTVLIRDEVEGGAVSHLQRFAQSPNVRLLIYGSFHRMFQLPGSYLVGDATLIEELRYSSRGYMFSTSQQPYSMAMINSLLSRGS